jgi:hypothetical protein
MGKIQEREVMIYMIVRRNLKKSLHIMSVRSIMNDIIDGSDYNEESHMLSVGSVIGRRVERVRNGALVFKRA